MPASAPAGRASALALCISPGSSPWRHAEPAALDVAAADAAAAVPPLAVTAAAGSAAALASLSWDDQLRAHLLRKPPERLAECIIGPELRRAAVHGWGRDVVPGTCAQQPGDEGSRS